MAVFSNREERRGRMFLWNFLFAHGDCRSKGEEVRNFPHLLPFNPSRAFSPLRDDFEKPCNSPP